ncbi:response regulator transcription factor [Christensenellaceae bacterium OttesenSCG-928-K19]|nr:response regulator transcription factor [Christensenellaceae bacterium OttesenSCG-928-K19]
MKRRTTLLLVEDSVDLLLINRHYLEKLGYRVLCTETLADAKKALIKSNPDLIVLDIMLPDGSGLDFLSVIRERTQAPVIFLTCLTDKKDIVEGLKRGGDDYITKPYELEVLGARIEARLRRAQKEDREWSFGTLTLDVFARRAFINGEDAMLQPKEFTLLQFLAKNEGVTFTNEELFDVVWGDSKRSDSSTIKSRLYNIKKKLDMKEGDGWKIERVAKNRYRFIRS